MFSVVFEGAFQEITLCIFTTLAPASIVSCLIVAATQLVHGVGYEMRYSVNKAFAVSLAIASVGLIASTTHLGNPSNALYVLAGVGRSPLSNEVFTSIMFLACAALFWLVAFSEQSHVKLLRVIYAGMSISAVAFMTAMAFAYHVDTIPTWSLSVIPVSVLFNALFCGPILALGTLLFSEKKGLSVRITKILIVIVGVCFTLNIVTYVIQGFTVLEMGNYMVHMFSLTGWFWTSVVLFIALGGSAVVLFVISQKEMVAWYRKAGVAAFVLGFLAIFAMRFVFYLTHMTVGLGF